MLEIAVVVKVGQNVTSDFFSVQEMHKYDFINKCSTFKTLKNHKNIIEQGIRNM